MQRANRLLLLAARSLTIELGPSGSGRRKGRLLFCWRHRRGRGGQSSHPQLYWVGGGRALDEKGLESHLRVPHP